MGARNRTSFTRTFFVSLATSKFFVWAKRTRSITSTCLEGKLSKFVSCLVRKRLRSGSSEVLQTKWVTKTRTSTFTATLVIYIGFTKNTVKRTRRRSSCSLAMWLKLTTSMSLAPNAMTKSTDGCAYVKLRTASTNAPSTTSRRSA